MSSESKLQIQGCMGRSFLGGFFGTTDTAAAFFGTGFGGSFGGGCKSLGRGWTDGVASEATCDGSMGFRIKFEKIGPLVNLGIRGHRASSGNF